MAEFGKFDKKTQEIMEDISVRANRWGISRTEGVLMLSLPRKKQTTLSRTHEENSKGKK
jgi:hypothetical protein